MGVKHSLQRAEIPIKLFINEAQKKVAFAEVNRDLADILLSLLVTPVGTAVRLASGRSQIGCMDSLYKSVENLEQKTFSTEACKKMLLYPNNAFRSECYKLPLNTNDKLSRHYICNYAEKQEHRFWSTIEGASCPHCGWKMERVPIHVYSDKSPSDVGVFLKGNNKYSISDDLLLSSIGSGRPIDELKRVGAFDCTRLREKKIMVGQEEVLKLFNKILKSKTPLTDTFLERRKKVDAETNETAVEDEIFSVKQPDSTDEPERKRMRMYLDLFINKSNGELLYAQAQEDVVNLVFSFLTFPMGLVSYLLDGSSSVGSIDQLRRSAADLNQKNQIRTDEHSTMLVKPKISPHHSFKDQLLKIEEGSYVYMVRGIPFDVINPKIGTSISTEKGGSFINGPTTFMITDELDIKVASLSQSMSITQNHKNVDVIRVKIGELEALKLLKASLITARPLSKVFREEMRPFIKQQTWCSFRPQKLFTKSWLRK